MLFACIVVPCFVVQASLRCEPEPKRLAWSTRPAPSPFSMALIRCREFSSVATSMHGEQGTFSAFLSSQGGGEEGRHGEVLRSFRVAGRFAARSNWQADLGDFEREVGRDVRTIALDDQGGAGADGEARHAIGEQGGRQARRPKASTVNFPSMNRRPRA